MASANTENTRDLTTLLQQAEALRQSGQMDAALALCEQAAALHPTSAETQEALSLLLIDLRRYAEAARAAQAFVALQPKSPTAHNIHAYALLCIGQYAQAVQSYDRVLALQPKAAGIQGDRAVALLQLKQFKEALKGLDKAIMLQPKNAAFHSNRGNVLKEMEHYAEALKSYDRAIALLPDFADAHSNRALVLNRLQRFEEALASCGRALASNPASAEAHNNHGFALRGLNRFAEALESYERALALNPDFAAALTNRGVVLVQLARYEEALASLSQAVALQPALAEAYGHRGLALRGLERNEEALASYDAGLALQPDLPALHEGRAQTLVKLKHYREALTSAEWAVAAMPNNITARNAAAAAHHQLGNYAQALAHYDRILALDPADAVIYNDRGVTLTSLHRRDAALADYDRATQLKPDYADAHWNKSLCHLLFGEFEQAWPLYEWRWQTEMFLPVARNFEQPLWLGKEPIAGKTILIYPEQGFGDFIQCARYVPLLEEMGAQVVLETYGAFLTLMRSLTPHATLVAHGEALPPFDIHCPIMSLPLAFGTRADTVPHNAPYLAADPIRQAVWKAKLGPKTRPRIGLVWSGSSAHGNDHNRSIALATLAPLLKLPLEFHALQKEFRADEQAMLARLPSLHTHADALQEFADTAALMAEMDMVVSVDTSAAHLAGALGKPVWLLLPSAPDYRWMLGREDSPWYPSMRLFRQPETGDWPSVIDRVIEGLKATLPS